MASNREEFFTGESFAVVGNSEKATFPKLSYNGLKSLGKTVYPIDPSISEIEGDKAYNDFTELPDKVDHVILELPKEETKGWVAKAADAGIKNVWIHMECDTPEAVALAEEKGINLRTGTCAVMYVTPGFTYHSIHKWIMKMVRKY